MPSPRAQLKSNRGWGEDHFAMLAHGHDYFGAWHREWYRQPNRDELLADMHACWQRHGGRIIAEFRADLIAHDGHYPWGWWQWTSPEPRNENVPEWFQLWKLGIIDEAEARRAAEFEIAHDPMAGWHGNPAFRRSMGFWCFVTTETRDESICELSQLVRMKILTPREQQFLDGDEKAIRESANSLRHLTAEECKLLGIAREESCPV